MKQLSLALIFLGLISLLSFSPRESLYQVITAHPHDLEALNPFIKTIHESGRLKVITLKPEAPASVYQYLKPIISRVDSYYPSINRNSLYSNPEIKNFTNQVSASLIKKDVEFLSAFSTRKAGTSENQKATSDVEERFKAYGYETTRSCYRPDTCSVIAEKKGISNTDQVIIVLGHIDSVGASFAGADDNASGTAVILEMARVLKDHPQQKNLRFFITNGEENGLLGAKHYVSELKRSSKVKDVILAINMDMVGYNSNGIVELETNEPYEKLAQWFAQFTATYTTLKTKITIGAWGSDHVPFLDAKVPAILTIEDWSTKTPCYHKACDKPETLNYGYAGEIAKLNISAVLTKDLE